MKTLWRHGSGEEDENTNVLALFASCLLLSANVTADFDRGLAAYNAGDVATALSEWKSSAEEGDADAQFGLGVLYEEGKGVQLDDREAAKWHSLAAQQGHIGAQYNLGVMYANGRGVPKDDSEAFKWLVKSADQGDAATEFAVAVMYHNAQGITQSNMEAVRWYTKAANQGHAEAQYNLGQLNRKGGGGIVRNDKEAVRWYAKAAEQSLAKAQYNLGYMYSVGKGTPQDDVYAHMWFNIASSNGSENARANRDIVAKRMTPNQLAEAQSLARECVKKDYKNC
jgi:hypothetical protein